MRDGVGQMVGTEANSGMSLNKGIESGKEKRVPDRLGHKWRTCRNHGGCEFCESGRQHFDTKRRRAAARDQNEWEKELDDD